MKKNRKAVFVSFRVTTDEHEKIKLRAAKGGFTTVSRYLRFRALGRKPDRSQLTIGHALRKRRTKIK